MKGQREKEITPPFPSAKQKKVRMQQLVGALKSIYMHMHCIYIRILHLRSFKILETKGFW